VIWPAGGRPIAPREGSRLPGQATLAAGLGQPGILPAHHGRLLLRPAHPAGRQRQPASNRLSRAEGPARRDIGPWRTLPTARCTDHDERAQGRRGATGPDPRTAQSRSARSGGGSSRRKLPEIGSRPSAAEVNHGRVTMYAVGPAGMQDSRIWAASVLNRKRAGSRNRKRAGSRAERTDTRAAMTAEPAAVRDQQTAEGAGRRSRAMQRLGRATDTRHRALPRTCRRSPSPPGPGWRPPTSWPPPPPSWTEPGRRGRSRR